MTLMYNSPYDSDSTLMYGMWYVACSYNSDGLGRYSCMYQSDMITMKHDPMIDYTYGIWDMDI